MNKNKGTSKSKEVSAIIYTDEYEQTAIQDIISPMPEGYVSATATATATEVRVAENKSQLKEWGAMVGSLVHTAKSPKKK